MGNYLPSPRLTPKNYQLGIYELSDNLTIDQITCDRLKDDWAQSPYPSSTQDIGDICLDLNQSRKQGGGIQIGMEVLINLIIVGIDSTVACYAFLSSFSKRLAWFFILLTSPSIFANRKGAPPVYFSCFREL